MNHPSINGRLYQNHASACESQDPLCQHWREISDYKTHNTSQLLRCVCPRLSSWAHAAQSRAHASFIGVFQCRYRIGEGCRSRGGLSAVAQCRTRTPWPRWLNWLVYCTQQDMSWAGTGAFTTTASIDTAVVWGFVRMPASHCDVVTLRTWMPPPSGHDRTGVETEIKAK